MVCSSTAVADPWYVGINGGAVWLMDSDIKNGQNGKAEFDLGFGVGGDVGYDFGPVRIEGEIEYRLNDYDKAGLDSVGTSKSGGSYKSLALMVNGYYDFENSSAFTPFLMVGIGGANVDTDSLTSGGLNIPSDNSWQFAYQVGAGVGWEFANSWILDLSYRFQSVLPGHEKVQEDHVEARPLRRFDGALPVLHGHDFVALLFENHRQGPAKALIVLYDQHAGFSLCHPKLLLFFP